MEHDICVDEHDFSASERAVRVRLTKMLTQDIPTACRQQQTISLPCCMWGINTLKVPTVVAVGLELDPLSLLTH